MVLLAIGFCCTIYLAVSSSSDNPPNGSQSAVLVVLAGVFQLGSAGFFFRAGRADPQHVRSAMRRLSTTARRVEQTRRLAETAYDGGNVKELRMAMGRLSVDMSWVEEFLVDNLADWAELGVDPSELEIGRADDE